MTKQEAIDKTLEFTEPYLKQDSLNDAQAARIGRTLYANLRQAERDKLFTGLPSIIREENQSA